MDYCACAERGRLAADLDIMGNYLTLGSWTPDLGYAGLTVEYTEHFHFPGRGCAGMPAAPNVRNSRASDTQVANASCSTRNTPPATACSQNYPH